MARGSTASNTGIGTYDLLERAYTAEDSRFGLFLQQNGPLGRRFVLNTRLSIFGSDSDARSAVEAPTIIVNDAFTSGGAQRRGGTHARNYWFNSDLDYVRGIHSMRTASRSRTHDHDTDSDSNYLGTYVFERPRRVRGAHAAQLHAAASAIRSVSYTNVQGGVYIQDDIKVRKGLTVTGGVRYEAQTHVPDTLNFAPRAGFTWAPFKSGKTTLRGSWGMFYDWLPTGTYAQTLQVDGFRQRELNIINPSFPDPGDVGIDAADQPLPARRGPRHGVFAAAQRRHRADDLAPDQHQRALQLRLSLFAADRPQPQHAGQRRPARSRVRQRRPGDRRTARARSTTSTRR